MAHKTKTVAPQMVERASVDVEKLLDLLVRNAAAELTTYYYYTILRTSLIGFEGEGLREIAEDARIEDRNHFEALVPRIYELGGELPASMVDFHNLSARPAASRSNQHDRYGHHAAQSRAVCGSRVHEYL
jgi:ferritin-like protein